MVEPGGSIQQAVNQLRPGDIAWVKTGVYRESVSMKSGSPDAPVQLRAFPGDSPVINGTDLLTGWTKTDHPSGKVWKTAGGSSLGAGNDQVFVDGVMMVEARWPNINKDPAVIRREDLAKTSEGSANGGSATLKCAALATAKGLPIKDIRINILPGALWWPITGTVTSISGDTLSYTCPPQGEEWSQPYAGSLFYLWGSPALLDAPREWARDGKDILIWMPAGDDPSKHVVEIKRRRTGIDLRAKKNAVVQGLHVFGCTIMTDQGSSEDVIDGITARYLTHYTVIPGWWLINPDALHIAGSNNKLVNCDIGLTASTAVNVSGKGHLIANNLIHDSGYVGAKGPLVHLWKADATTVEHNAMWNTGGHNVVELTESTGSIIRSNDLSGSAIQAIDEGIIQIKRNFDGKNTIIDGNWIHDNFGLSGGKNYYGNAGIYSEPGSSGYTITKNVIWRTVSPAIAITGAVSNFVIDGNYISGGLMLNGVKANNPQSLSLNRPAGSGPVGDSDPLPPGPYAGAYVASVHVPFMSVDGAGRGAPFVLGNLPPGRIPGPDFKIKVGSAEAGGTVSKREGRWVVTNVPWPSNAGNDPKISVQIGTDRPIPLPRKKKSKLAGADTAAAGDTGADGGDGGAATKPPSVPKPEALAKWEGRLLDRVRAAVKAGKGPQCSVSLGRERIPVVIMSISEDLILEVKMTGAGGTGMTLPWKRVEQTDRLGIAKTLRKGFDPADNAVLAFYALMQGDTLLSDEALMYSGDLAQEVRDSFEAAPPPAAKPAPAPATSTAPASAAAATEPPQSTTSSPPATDTPPSAAALPPADDLPPADAPPATPPTTTEGGQPPADGLPSP